MCIFLNRTTNAGTIAPGPQTYCSCGPVIAGINTKTSDNTVYSICAGDPYPTIASSTIEPVKTTAPEKPKPSEAIIVYREDSCQYPTLLYLRFLPSPIYSHGS